MIYISIDKDMIETMIISELHKAEKKFKPFNSGHEGWAIIKEEIEEMQEILYGIDYYMDAIWNYVRENSTTQQLFHAQKMYDVTLDIIKEAIQVAAMCKRFQKDLGTGEIK